MTKELRNEGRSHLVPERDPDLMNKRAEPQPSDYLADVADLGLEEKQALELLGIMMSIMRSFVQMGFDVNVCEYVFRDYVEFSHGDSELGYAASEKPDDGKQPE